MKKTIIVLAVLLLIINGWHYYIYENRPVGMNEENFIRVTAIDQTESMQHERFIPEEYIPVEISGVNIAPEGKADSSEFEGVYNGKKAIDGKRIGVSYWEAKADTYPNELSVSFEEPRTIHGIKVALNPEKIWGKRLQSFSINYTDENGETKELYPEGHYTFDPDRGNEVVFEFDDVTVMSVILIFTENTGAGGGQVAEFEIYE